MSTDARHPDLTPFGVIEPTGGRVLALHPCLPLVLTASLVALAGSAVAAGHRAATRSAVEGPTRRGRSRDE
jgi:hypothetical protein